MLNKPPSPSAASKSGPTDPQPPEPKNPQPLMPPAAPVPAVPPVSGRRPERSTMNLDTDVDAPRKLPPDVDLTNLPPEVQVRVGADRTLDQGQPDATRATEAHQRSSIDLNTNGLNTAHDQQNAEVHQKNEEKDAALVRQKQAGIHALVVDGAAASTDISVPGLDLGDTLESVKLASPPESDLTGMCSITKAGALRCTTDTSGKRLAVRYRTVKV